MTYALLCSPSHRWFRKLPYIFLSSELYYAVMCLDIEKQNFDAEEYFSSYYDFITPTVDDLYPSYVVEYNNIIEQYQAFILLKYAFGYIFV